MAPLAPKWFVQELALISADLKLEWGREDQGCDVWLVLRKQPDDIHAVVAGEFERAGRERFVDQKLVDEDDNVVGSRRLDLCPQWIIAHWIHKRGGSREEFREPDMGDIRELREWMFRYSRVEDQIRELRDELDTKEENKKIESDYARRNAIRAGRGRWRGDVFADVDKSKVLEGTEV